MDWRKVGLFLLASLILGLAGVFIAFTLNFKMTFRTEYSHVIDTLKKQRKLKNILKEEDFSYYLLSYSEKWFDKKDHTLELEFAVSGKEVSGYVRVFGYYVKKEVKKVVKKNVKDQLKQYMKKEEKKEPEEELKINKIDYSKGIDNKRPIIIFNKT